MSDWKGERNGSIVCYQWVLSFVRAVEKEKCDQFWDFTGPWNAYNPLFMRSQFSFRGFVNRKFGEEATHWGINSYNQQMPLEFSLYAGHLAGAWCSVQNKPTCSLRVDEPVFVTSRQWDNHSKMWGHFHGGVPSIHWGPKGDLIFLSVCNWGTFSWIRQKFKERCSSR